MTTLDILQAVAAGQLTPTAASAQLEASQTADLGFANVDLSRQQRNGVPEVVYGAGKTATQIVGIIQAMPKQITPILTTRLSAEKFAALQPALPQAVYHAAAQCMTVGTLPTPATDDYIAVVTAGTSDQPVAEEAAITAQAFGNHVERVYDVGVAGIHRLFAKLDVIRGAKVVIVIAGMEGALASVVGGLIDKPLIAVPTSVGYGTNFQGMTALLTMLNSCASGITVVNIDNGFGAAYSASMINQL
ncbi:1-(5-phosphoribosyl)-5-amino-4-imidazole-carboxylate carboxylase [Lactobacillus sp.] [Lactiplantibacillus mudanjiangensis]|uniref:nickel pincer cofactor biosynthesis protein LarB n=1 Tax=Lactiplantibacillus mudanjiangensis TaxID=1296538 RepID=UPI0010144206|nr:nickel pincer cofactor biosynthesis protein LarB [Lactiplantibacillus mudanjiangensis]VDG31892.1 1-(5-phosphoribosyl)-5-amino-4-imidazole-carboxylate carboxylase [Lactobacillus sp.] [Lactiplantibacillus mudanjiangensis]